MSCCDGTNPACPCGAFVHPWVITNPPGLTSLAARSGDYVAYRHALLQALPGETELSRSDGTTTTQIWRPSAEGDLALQMVEWWAYLADILTFYNERVTNESYLRTAQLPESIHRLIGLLGYRPRPALGARATLAALVNRARAVVVPRGLQVQSKPGPGKSPQIFEIDVDTSVSRPDAAPALLTPLPPASIVATPPGGAAPVATLLVSGRLGTVKPGDELLLVKVGWDGTTEDYASGIVSTLTDQIAPGGAHNTQIVLAIASQANGDFSDTSAAHWRLLKGNGTATLYPYLDSTTLKSTGSAPFSVDAHLASIFRQIKPGDLVLIDDTRVSSPNLPYLGVVTAYKETIYYANNPSSPSTPPPETSPLANIPAVPILHTVITFTTPDTVTGNAATVVVRYGFKDVGQLIDPPATTIGGSSGGAVQTIAPAAPAPAPAGAGTTASGAVNSEILVADVNGDGALATVDGNGNVTLDTLAPTLVPPLTALFNLVPVSRGKTVANEILGSGDGTVLSQDFQLQKAPVTYFADGVGLSGAGYSSTVRVWVNGVQWQEVASFFGQAASAQVFMTREDDNGNTHVVFGDGVSGARLPTGVNNVVASYRYGAGAEVPDAGTLVSVLQAQPGLASVVNPVAPAGGADADPPGKIRSLAPQSVLTFGRAVSLDDYQTLAASAAGVTAAQASYSFDPLAQRPTVHVWVAGDAGAAASARAAIAVAADPNRAFKVDAAGAVTVWLTLTYVRDPRYQDSAVSQGIHDALLDSDRGLLGSNRVQIGAALFDSDIYAACLAVPGVLAVHNLFFNARRFIYLSLPYASLTRQTIGGFRALAAQRKLDTRFPMKIVASATSGPGQSLILRRPYPPSRAPCQLERYSPGDGQYFLLPDDGAHLTLNAELPS